MFRRLLGRLFGRRGDVTDEDRERLHAREEERRQLAREAERRTSGDSVSGTTPYWADPR
jgi:hypothetical protein